MNITISLYFCVFLLVKSTKRTIKEPEPLREIRIGSSCSTAENLMLHRPNLRILMYLDISCVYCSSDEELDQGEGKLVCIGSFLTQKLFCILIS